MTVLTDITDKTYAGDGAVFEFSTKFTFDANSEVKVSLSNDTTGASADWIEGTQYALTGAGTGNAGTVTVNTSPTDYTPLSGETLVIELDPAFTQPTPLPRGGTVSPKAVLEPMHDSRVRQILTLKKDTDRSIKTPVVDASPGLTLPIAALRANKFLSFDAIGDVIVQTLADIGSIIVSSIPPLGTGTTSAGTSDEVSRSDHVHAIPTNGIVAAMITALNVTTGKIAALAVTTAKIANDSVTLAKMAGGTDGNLITYDTSGDPAFVATGTVGQVLTSGGAGAAPTMQSPSGLTLGTSVASTSGTSIDFTGFPAGTKRITINLNGVSVNVLADMLYQLGDAGGIETSGYLGAGSNFVASTGVTGYTAGLGVRNVEAGATQHGRVVLELENSSTNTWSMTLVSGAASGAQTNNSGASKSLSAELSQLRITTVAGTSTFDAGSINVTYE